MQANELQIIKGWVDKGMTYAEILSQVRKEGFEMTDIEVRQVVVALQRA